MTEMSANYTCSCLDTIIVFFGTKFIEFILQHYCLLSLHLQVYGDPFVLQGFLLELQSIDYNESRMVSLLQAASTTLSLINL